MVFKCQEDSFLKEYKSKVLKCEPTSESICEYGKTLPFEGYKVTLENTIIFPAGGGQPHDHGWLNDVEVLQVLRKGPEALHFIKEPIEVGTEVVQKIDWERRFDHMQQHSGQHLLSAILEKDHNLKTTSWWMGSDESYIELDAPSVSDDIVRDVEEKCNRYIRECLPVVVKFTNINDPTLKETGRHNKGLPEDCIDTIRVICIGDVDENLCCGTHVTNLSQLQMIKVIAADSAKKGKTNFRFVVGTRVLKTLQLMLNREKAISVILNNDANRHPSLIESLQRKVKTLNKNLNNILSELAAFEIDKVKNSEVKPKFIFIFKKDANPEFNRIMCKGLENEGIFMFLASEDSERPKEGQVIMQGSEEHCNNLGKQICDILKCKGTFKNGKFQGKAGDLSAIVKCRKIVEEYFSKIG